MKRIETCKLYSFYFLFLISSSLTSYVAFTFLLIQRTSYFIYGCPEKVTDVVSGADIISGCCIADCAISFFFCVTYLSSEFDVQQIVPPVLHSFSHQDSRVRYYACEALYNIAKVRKIKEPVLRMFFWVLLFGLHFCYFYRL